MKFVYVYISFDFLELHMVFTNFSRNLKDKPNPVESFLSRLARPEFSPQLRVYVVLTVNNPSQVSDPTCFLLIEDNSVSSHSFFLIESHVISWLFLSLAVSP